MLIKYNGQDVFSGQAEPLVSKTTAFTSQGDNRILLEETIGLAGELTGCGIDELIAARNSALNVFATGFKDLEVTGIGIFTGVKIQGINFDQSPYLSSLPYNITLLHYPSGGYEFGHGITNPQSVYTYTENQDQTVSIQHEASAKGVNTSTTLPGGNALYNAKNFVSGQITGVVPRPALIDTTASDFSSYLVDFSETVDKLNNTISVSRTFETDPSAAVGSVILRYTSSVSPSEGEELLISYNGTVDAGRKGSMAGARSKYSQFRDGVGAVRFMTENVTEDEDINNISFSFSHIQDDTDPDGIVDDFTITIEEGSDSSLFSASINGTLSTRGRCIGAAWDELKGYYNTPVNGPDHNYSFCQDVYDDFYTEDHGSCLPKPKESLTLHEKAISKSVGYNEHAQTMSYSASYNDRETLDGLHTFDYTMNFTPSLPAIKSVASAYNNGWIFEDLMYRNRGSFSISLNARSLSPGEANISKDTLLEFGENKFHKMTESPIDQVTTSNEYVLNNQSVASATFAKTFHSVNAFVEGSCGDPESYTGILTFEV